MLEHRCLGSLHPTPIILEGHPSSELLLGIAEAVVRPVFGLTPSSATSAPFPSSSVHPQDFSIKSCTPDSISESTSQGTKLWHMGSPNWEIYRISGTAGSSSRGSEWKSWGTVLSPLLAVCSFVLISPSDKCTCQSRVGEGFYKHLHRHSKYTSHWTDLSHKLILRQSLWLERIGYADYLRPEP